MRVMDLLLVLARKIREKFEWEEKINIIPNFIINVYIQLILQFRNIHKTYYCNVYLKRQFKEFLDDSLSGYDAKYIVYCAL